MRPCPTCGEPNPESARFCSSCGALLDARPLRAVRKRVTVVFCDVAGATAESAIELFRRKGASLAVDRFTAAWA